jgi:hypothetical protein
VDAEGRGARSLSEPLRKQPDQRFSHSPLEGGYEGPPRAERSDSSRRLAFHSFIPASIRCPASVIRSVATSNCGQSASSHREVRRPCRKCYGYINKYH